MTYATQADLIDRFGESELAQLTDRVNGSTIDTAALSRALADADAEINGYLAGRYALPLSTTPPMLVRMASDIARYSLYGSGTPDVVRQRYEDVVSLLKRLADGQVKLDAQETAAVSGIDVAYHSFTPRAITDDTLRGFA